MMNGESSEPNAIQSPFVTRQEFLPVAERVIELTTRDAVNTIRFDHIEKNIEAMTKNSEEMVKKFDEMNAILTKIASHDKIRSWVLYGAGGFILAHFTGVLKFLMKLAS